MHFKLLEYFWKIKELGHIWPLWSFKTLFFFWLFCLRNCFVTCFELELNFKTVKMLSKYRGDTKRIKKRVAHSWWWRAVVVEHSWWTVVRAVSSPDQNSTLTTSLTPVQSVVTGTRVQWSHVHQSPPMSLALLPQHSQGHVALHHVCLVLHSYYCSQECQRWAMARVAL